jgi:hypothetical protein
MLLRLRITVLLLPISASGWSSGVYLSAAFHAAYVAEPHHFYSAQARDTVLLLQISASGWYSGVYLSAAFHAANLCSLYGQPG